MWEEADSRAFFRPLRRCRLLSACISTEGSGQERVGYKRGKRGGGGLKKRETRKTGERSERKDGKEEIASLASSHGKQFLNVTLSLAARYGLHATYTALCRGA